MSFFRETEHVGKVVTPPEIHEMHPRPGNPHSGGVLTLMFRMEEASGPTWSVMFRGQLQGKLQLGDMVAVRGYALRSGVIKASRIYHPGGPRPVIIADVPRICLVRSLCLFPPGMLRLICAFRDRSLAGGRIGDRVIVFYYGFSRWAVLRLECGHYSAEGQ
ncbi:MAG: hypothetical protein C4524_11695 [Candidatus Zixiibacteriota bacterium]|nr:MAG: hypothetical protein C4524_11695 [candidate division Zixibacteria bacterium]